MNPLKKLNEHGQSFWLDFLSRGFLESGGLQKLIDEDGLKGVTSNPSIFEKAIVDSKAYQAQITAAPTDLPIMTLYEQLAISDIQQAADTLRPVYDALDGRDGFVSLEVSPSVAASTDATIAEGRFLWKSVDRENLMVKVPATTAGLSAIRQLTSEGINVNVTLLFSQHVYEQVVEAYLAGLESLARETRDLSRIASVASFFVSRIDPEIDKLLMIEIERTGNPDRRKTLESLKGKVAIANAKLAYRRYKDLFASARWQALSEKGARTQRLLWASTSTKNANYPDVLYVDELIGADTVNTMPLKTIDAYRDHGAPRNSLEENVTDAEATLKTLDEVGISLESVAAKLLSDGVRSFAGSFATLLGTIDSERKAQR